MCWLAASEFPVDPLFAGPALLRQLGDGFCGFDAEFLKISIDSGGATNNAKSADTTSGTWAPMSTASA